MKSKIIITIIILLAIIGAYAGYRLSTNDIDMSTNTDNIESTQTINNLDVSEFKAELEVGHKVLIDIRTQEELDAIGLIGNKAIHLDIYESNFSNELDKLDKNEKYLIYCAHGNRSKSALDIMKNKGFKYVKDLNGGINAWIDNGEDIFK